MTTSSDWWACRSLLERDMWLAKRMGWTDFSLTYDRLAKYTGGRAKRRTVFPSYSTDIAAAMGLAKDLFDRGWAVTICFDPNCGRCYCSVHLNMDDDCIVASGDSLPAVMAEAAYLALKDGE